MLCPGLTPLDLIGPLQVISGLEVVEATFGMRRRHHVVVVAETLDAVPTDTPVHVAATTLLDEVPSPISSWSLGRGRPLPEAPVCPPESIPLCDWGPNWPATTSRSMIQLGIEYDPQPPYGGIDWPHLDRDSFGPPVEGFAHQALD